MAKKKESTKIQKIDDIEPETITFRLNLNNQKSEVTGTNILTALRDLKIEPEEVKTRALFEVVHGERIVRKVMYVPQFRKFIQDDLHRRLLAKFFGVALYLKPQSYE